MPDAEGQLPSQMCSAQGEAGAQPVKQHSSRLPIGLAPTAARLDAGLSKPRRPSFSSAALGNLLPEVSPAKNFTSTLLEHLLTEKELGRECDDDDFERTVCAVGTAHRPGKRSMRRRRGCAHRATWKESGFRVLDRAGPFGQSKGTWAIHNVTSRNNMTPDGAGGSKDVKGELRQLFAGDLYHAFLDAPFSVQLLLVLLLFLGMLCIYAVVFLVVEEDCGLKLEFSFTRAYMLSVETMLTVGYGVSDPYMHGCWQGPVILTSQGLVYLLMDACLIGVIFQGLSRPQSRASTILFSEKAVITSADGALFLKFRMADLRIQHALIEPHVRCYCIHMSQEAGARLEMLPMQLEQPMDGAALVPSLPNTIVHRIDSQSPLAPRVHRQRHLGRLTSARSMGTLWSNGSQEMAASQGGQSYTCETCGASFADLAHLRHHCRYLAQTDRLTAVPEDYCHRELEAEESAQLLPPEIHQEELMEHLARGYFEVVVLVEGTEPTTASTLQKRHSYVVSGTTGSDVVWGAEFVECCHVHADSSQGLVVDLSRFHAVLPAPED